MKSNTSVINTYRTALLFRHSPRTSLSDTPVYLYRRLGSTRRMESERQSQKSRHYLLSHRYYPIILLLCNTNIYEITLQTMNHSPKSYQITFTYFVRKIHGRYTLPGFQLQNCYIYCLQWMDYECCCEDNISIPFTWNLFELIKYVNK